QVLDVVADAARPVGAEVREVLAHLGRVHSGQLREAFGGDGRDLALARLQERPVIERQAGNGRLRDPASWRSCHPGVLSALRTGARFLPAGYRACVLVLKVCGPNFWVACAAPPIRMGRSRCASHPVGSAVAPGTLAPAMVAGLAFLATAVATLFAQATGVRYSRSKPPYQGAWTFALALFALASAALATAESTG